MRIIATDNSVNDLWTFVDRSEGLGLRGLIGCVVSIRIRYKYMIRYMKGKAFTPVLGRREDLPGTCTKQGGPSLSPMPHDLSWDGRGIDEPE